MFNMIIFAQLLIFLTFCILERLYPARHLPRAKNFSFWLAAIASFAYVWFSFVYLWWVSLPKGLISINMDVFNAGILFFFVWSFVGYWWHRLRHSNKILWHVIHRFHHSAPKMETALILFKHPAEFIANTIIITTLLLIFDFAIYSVIVGLAIEAALESYHHSNIKTPASIRWIGHIIQTPEMHLIHHQRGHHKDNYATFLWDSVFGTLNIPTEWSGQQGLKAGKRIGRVFFLR